jgi:hypothetical protein
MNEFIFSSTNIHSRFRKAINKLAKYDPDFADFKNSFTEEQWYKFVSHMSGWVVSSLIDSEEEINTDPRLTQYINDTTKLKNKGSNLGNNINQVSKHKKLAKTEGACHTVADAVDYKNRSGI